MTNTKTETYFVLRKGGLLFLESRIISLKISKVIGSMSLN